MSEAYNVFVSWSGSRSKWVAQAIKDWLPLVLQTAKPWISTNDVEKGTRGLGEVSTNLQGIKIGIVCLTPENLNAPWILHEAGALSKTIDEKTRLCTYLLGGLQFQDVKPPLGMFQATRPDKNDTLEMVRTINVALGETVGRSNLDRIFDHMWPELEERLLKMPSTGQAASPKRSTEDMITEILELSRAEVNSTKLMQDQVSYIHSLLERRPLFGGVIPPLNPSGQIYLGPTLNDPGFTSSINLPVFATPGYVVTPPIADNELPTLSPPPKKGAKNTE